MMQLFTRVVLLMLVLGVGHITAGITPRKGAHMEIEPIEQSEPDKGNIQWVPAGVEMDDTAWQRASPYLENVEVATVSSWRYNFQITRNQKVRDSLVAQGIDLEKALADHLDKLGPIAPAPPVGYRTWGLYCQYTNPYYHMCDSIYRNYLEKYYFVGFPQEMIQAKVDEMMRGNRIRLVTILYTAPNFLKFLNCEAVYHYPQDHLRYEQLC